MVAAASAQQVASNRADDAQIERIALELAGERVGLLGAIFRYEVMERLARSAASRTVRILAFGFGPDGLRLVLDGAPDDVTNVLRGLKVGTIRAAARWDVSLRAGPTLRKGVDPQDLLDAVAWAHRGPVDAGALGPLASPWSSHRDLFGYRKAAFYDASVLRGRIDLADLERRFGAPTSPVTSNGPVHAEDLNTLLRVAGAVLGVLPADRRCFRLFVHLAKLRGYGTGDLAKALSVTSRRVRQLAAEREPDVNVALVSLADPHLSRVP